LDWLTYFEEHRRQPFAGPSCSPRLAPEIRETLMCSLQRFQVGERGGGDHLLAAARTHGDVRYSAALDLFIGEEQEHARLLARAIERLGGRLLESHWTDNWFVKLRHLGGLRTELLVLLAAELIGLCYYRSLRDGIPDRSLRMLFGRIVRDEEAHVAFHCDSLRALMGDQPWPRRTLSLGAWQAFYVVVATVVAIDHGAVLLAAGRSRAQFLAECETLLAEALARISSADASEPLKQEAMAPPAVTAGQPRSRTAAGVSRRTIVPDRQMG
jgi:hypothetical protein